MDITSIVKLSKSELFVDIGANDGDVMRKVRDEWSCKVIGFEPNPRPELGDDLEWYPMAVGSSSGTAEIHCYGFDGESDCLVKRVDKKPLKLPWSERFEGAKKVKKISFADIISKHGDIGFCNMDCEGSEYDILLNTHTKYLRRCKAYFVEFHIGHDFDDDRDYKQLTARCVLRLRDNGFTAKPYIGKHTYYLFRRVA